MWAWLNVTSCSTGPFNNSEVVKYITHFNNVHGQNKHLLLLVFNKRSVYLYSAVECETDARHFIGRIVAVNDAKLTNEYIFYFRCEMCCIFMSYFCFILSWLVSGCGFPSLTEGKMP